MPKILHEYIFTFHKVYKSSRKSASFSRLVFHEYAAVKELCVVKAIDAYLSKIKT